MVFSAFLRAAASPSSHACHSCAQVLIHFILQGVEFPLCLLQACLQLRIGLAHLAGHAHLFKLHVQFEDFFKQIGGDARWIFAVFAAVLFADLRALQLQQVLGAVQRILQRAIGIVQQRRVRQAPLPLIVSGAGKAVRMDLAAQAVKLVLQRRQIQVQPRLQSEDRKIIAARGRLNLAAMRTEQEWTSLCATEHDQHATGTAESRTFNMTDSSEPTYEENDEPQPQDREEFGLMKLNPCRISVSS